MKNVFEPWFWQHYEIDLLDALTCGLAVTVLACDLLPMNHLQRSGESQRRVTSSSLRREPVITLSSAAMVNRRAHILWNDRRVSLMVLDFSDGFINWRWCTNLFSRWRRCRLRSLTHFVTLDDSLLSEELVSIAQNWHCCFD
jgi:hypothetical protein